MRSLSQIILLLTLSAGLYAQSPHGKELTMACADCHNPKGWKLEAGTYSFTHDKTPFPLTGMHVDVNCKLCHSSLVFSDAKTECVSCHTDMHYQTVGMECERCHTPQSWLVNNINEIHRQSRFPLVGAHITADCYSCHPSASLLRFEPLGVECYDCHLQDYQATTSPNHVEGGYSTECLDCHKMNAFTWSSSDINHAFFPLTEGHAISDCNACHTGNDYSNLSPECYSCHDKDYNEAASPNHLQAAFSTTCTECHTTQPDWRPANFQQHDGQYFPIYSGEHNGEWDNCADCHTNPGNYATNSCIVCHNDQAEMNEEHDEVGGYIYSDPACFECHPTGSADDNSFNHNASNFPLTGAHITTDCLECHANGYAGTTTICGDCHVDAYNQSTNPNHVVAGISTDCADCHTTEPEWKPATFAVHNDYYLLTGAHVTVANDCFSCHAGDYTNTPNLCNGCHADNYNQTTNPNHFAIGIENDCETCHTTNPEWKPATFPTHNNYYALIGAHATIATDCFTCHNGNYNTTPNTCYACHTEDYNQTTNPPHQSSQFSTDCESCHTQTAWEPSTFDHDGLYFPIYSGEHEGEWDQCIDCHTNPSNYAIFTCITCHEQGETNEEHEGISGYQYNSDACLACHPDGSATGAFNHSATNFPLTGAHTTVDCILCHESGYSGTSTICSDCHDNDFNQSTNPNHNTLGLSDDCETCHTTNPDWQPASFPVHNSFYVLAGAHVGISNDCFACHIGNYNTTPNTCYGCHASDYNQTNDPPHQSAQFPTDCEICHTQSAWEPSTFEHDGQFFPIYSGEHEGEWDQCSDCHTNPSNYAIFTCLTCHEQGETNSEHQGISGYQYNSDACLACHPDGSGSGAFNHNGTNFPLTGAHTTVECSLCHESGYSGTSTICSDCHEDDFNQSINPNHNTLGLSDDCETCHTTNANWQPATFPVHNSFYVLAGAHVGISNDCFTCHNGDYNNTPNTCFGCHESDYNQTNDPDHQTAQFPTECETCHSQSAWEPSTFEHDGQYFPIYSGEHEGEWDQCSDCHSNPGNYAIFSCFACHPQGEMDDEHEDVSGYQYNSDACLACHPDGEGSGAFNHSGTNFPLTGAHTTVACSHCHTNGYSGTSTICGDCHGIDFNQSTNPNHTAIGLSNNCATCHTTASGWEPATFPVHNNYYLLTGAHATISGDCFSCHAGNYNSTPNACNGCHTDSYNQSTNPNHNAIGISNDCASCHTTSPNWEPATFPVHNNYYLLSGAHATISGDCFSCHAGDYNNTPNVCNGCHTDNYNQTTNPNHVAIGISNDCATCHTTNPEWQPATLPTHSNYYALIGAHASIATDCFTCHNGNYNNTPNTCYACHTLDYNQTIDPPHQSAQFPTNCESCHTQTGWEPSTFNHDGQFFPIYAGEHNGEWDQCSDCHTNSGNYAIYNCLSCHPQGETNSEHQGVSGYQYSSDACFACHPDGSAAGAINHNATNFPLTGAHTTVECNLCHVNGYSGTSTICNDCHIDDFNQTTNPNHTAIGLSNNCASCHTTVSGWEPATFPVHNNYYLLTGAHATIAGDCFSCHAGDYNNTPIVCNGCHTDNYNQTANPNHIAIGISNECATCHTTNPDWQPATFPTHSNYYALIGAHANIQTDCFTCHNGNYNTTPNTCYGCHSSDYNQTNGPPHQSAQFPTDCESCHTQTGWEPSTFDHDGLYFPIYSGEHNGEWNQCNECHSNPGNFDVFTCFTCHSQGETNSEHQGISGYQYNSDACFACHPDGSGSGAFNHSGTNFPLTGAHTSVECSLCHTNGYSGTTNVCGDCHNDNFNQTTNPNHTALGLSNDCATCHTTNANWSPATFPVHNTFYVLAGAHVGIANDCFVCHNGNYNNTSNSCYGCHSTDYNQTSNPSHQPAQFPTDCEMCHTQNVWEPSTFNHDNQYFPIYSGAHNGEWDQCSECHTNPGNYEIFSCLTCHSQGETNSDHQGVNGYQYNSIACLNCHPNGEEKSMKTNTDY